MIVNEWHGYSASSMRKRVPLDQRPRGLPQVYRGRGIRTGASGILDRDHGEGPHGGRFRWVVSTCLAALVGAVAIVVVIYGSSDQNERPEGFMPALKKLQDNLASPAGLSYSIRREAGLNWAVPKSNKLQVTSGTLSTRYVIHESVKQRRDNRVYIHAKPYVRIVSRLAPVPKEYADVIPPFNPFKLYADSKPVGSGEQPVASGEQNEGVKIKVVELYGGILPEEDGQELDTNEVTELVEKVRAEELFAAANAQGNGGAGGPDFSFGENGRPSFFDDAATVNTTNLAKSVVEADVDSDALEGAKKLIVTVGANETLPQVLLRNGADKWQIDDIRESSNGLVNDDVLEAGSEVHITQVPSLSDPNQMEPIEFSVFSAGHVHKVTVARDDSGGFVVSDKPPRRAFPLKLDLAVADGGASDTLFAGVYYACLIQNVPSDTILKILKMHVYETDFRRRIRAGDTLELFFEIQDEDVTEGPPGELLYAKITSGGDSSSLYRFRTDDNLTDYYDPNGNNSKRFLMRKPVRGSGVRLTSGYGMRIHPLLNRRRMHTGVDWAAPTGTPILAAGKGEIEHAGRKGQYGNYVRIRHANGYQSTYAHMSRIARGVRQGINIRQGQIIGYVGSTGLSSGPHLHYEILVNKRFVNPMSIKVPKERQLAGEELNDFQRERARLDELMRRAPVKTKSK